MKGDQSCTEGREESDEISEGAGHVKLCFLSQESLIKFILSFIFTDAFLACLPGVCLISDLFLKHFLSTHCGLKRGLLPGSDAVEMNSFTCERGSVKTERKLDLELD